MYLNIIANERNLNDFWDLNKFERMNMLPFVLEFL